MKSILIFSVCLFLYTLVQANTDEIRIIYIIHADGNYLFHNEEGDPLNAAERMLSQSIFVEENIKNGEVLIFYQKPAENFLFFFPEDNGEFYYYKNGIKILDESYSRKDSSGFDSESSLLKKYSDPSYNNFRTVLLYYGHEIPLNDTSGYSQSQPAKEFGLNIFKEGIKQVFDSISSHKKFDMIVLSTCKNGNNKTAEELSPFADYLVGSPAEIHLSYLNSESLIKLSREGDLTAKEMAAEFAENAYNIMSQTVSTEVSISIFDLNKDVEKTPKDSNERITNLYRPAMFGRKIIH